MLCLFIVHMLLCCIFSMYFNLYLCRLNLQETVIIVANKKIPRHSISCETVDACNHV